MGEPKMFWADWLFPSLALFLWGMMWFAVRRAFKKDLALRRGVYLVDISWLWFGLTLVLQVDFVRNLISGALPGGLLRVLNASGPVWQTGMDVVNFALIVAAIWLVMPRKVVGIPLTLWGLLFLLEHLSTHTLALLPSALGQWASRWHYPARSLVLWALVAIVIPYTPLWPWRRNQPATDSQRRAGGAQ